MSIIQSALSQEALGVKTVVLDIDCDSSVAVNDLVYQDLIVSEEVYKSTNNTHLPKIFGICIQKYTSTRCRVLCMGVVSGYTDLIKGKFIFWGTSGEITSTKPSDGFLHILGFAISATKIYFSPNNIRVLQS